MFRNLLSFWKGKDFLIQVLEDFKAILDKTEYMFKAACDCLWNNTKVPGLEKTIYETDRQVNVLEKGIRKRIVEHIFLQPEVDVTCCLLLMSVVKDAERLGDYSKNLYEAVRLLQKPVNRALFSKWFDNLDKEILELFELSKQAFIESSDRDAVASWDRESGIAKRCDDIIEELTRSDLSVKEAVCFALTARYFKRLAAHLANIATSVVLPLSDLDYFDENIARG